MFTLKGEGESIKMQAYAYREKETSVKGNFRI